MFATNHQAAAKEADIELNRVVTPMLDMTFQILFFLIMNFRLPSPEGQIDLIFPKDPGPVGQEVEFDAPVEAEEYLLRLTIFERDGNQGERQGTIIGMKWRKKGVRIDDDAAEEIPRLDSGDRNEQDESFRQLNSLMYGLVVKLKQYQPREGGKQPTINIECPNKLKYAELLKVMDVMRKLKFKNVGVAQIP